MVTRDVNHACILFWDNANEGGWNRDLDKDFALYDPQNRTVLHPWENFNGIDTDHYYLETRARPVGDNVWHNTYKDHQPGVFWDFPEFRGYYRDWYWVTFDTTEGRVTLVNDTDDLYLGVYRPKDGPDPKNTALRVPDTQLALLHGIPAIGTKFLKAEALGPQSQRNMAKGRYKGTVYIKVDAADN